MEGADQSVLTICLLARPAHLAAPDGPKLRCKRLQSGEWGLTRFERVFLGGHGDDTRAGLKREHNRTGMGVYRVSGGAVNYYSSGVNIAEPCLTNRTIAPAAINNMATKPATIPASIGAASPPVGAEFLLAAAFGSCDQPAYNDKLAVTGVEK